MEGVTRFAEIIASLKEALLQQSFEAGKLLLELTKESDYGDWGTFNEFVQGELRIKPRTASRLMFAYEMRELFKKHGRVLPVFEGSVRPLSELRVDRQRTKITRTLEELQLKAWDIAVAMKQRSTPTGTDVRRAVRQLTGPKVEYVNRPGLPGLPSSFSPDQYRAGNGDETNAGSGRVSGGRRQKDQAPEKGFGQTDRKRGHVPQ